MNCKDTYRFVRFGGVNLKTQKGFKPKNCSFHSPPAARGFYAMPIFAQERFLITAMSVFQPGTVPKWRPVDDGAEDAEEKYNQEFRRHDRAIERLRKEFVKSSGHVWHHLVDHVSHCEIVARHGSWVKTHVSVWAKAISKASMIMRHEGAQNGKINETHAPGRFPGFSRDMFEVFFDEKV